MRLPIHCFAEVIDVLRVSARDGTGRENRGASRFSVQCRLALLPTPVSATEQAYTVVTRDIPQTGLGLLVASRWSADHHFVAILPRGRKTPAAVLCNVVYCRPLAQGLFALGAEFLDLMPDRTDSPWPCVDPRV